MAAIDELIQQIQDPTLRDRIQKEVNKMTKQKKFGLVFEEHLPECTPLYDMPIYKGTKVAKKTGKVDDIYIVLDFPKDGVLCKNVATKEEEVIPNAELVAVAEFGEAIYPYLKPIDTVCNAPDSDLWHTLIEADNYHALQLLEYLYAGKVDCIYIDPPYNTGARDWKYNNNYVDSADTYRHSKWLSFMEKRLKLAKKLLNPNDSVLIVAIDEKEYLHLGCLLEELFPESRMQMITSVISAKGVVRSGQFSRVEEYLFIIEMGGSQLTPGIYNMLDNDLKKEANREIEWLGFRRRAPQAKRASRPNQFYPVFVNNSNGTIHSIGDVVTAGIDRHTIPVPEGCTALWPLSKDGDERLWSLVPEQARSNLKKGYIRIKNWNSEEKTGTVYYLPSGTIKDIENGEVSILGSNPDGSVIGVYANEGRTPPKRVWNMKTHNAETYGTNVLNGLIGKRFDYPKSIYAVHDSIRFYLENKPDSLVVDFFAGSATTLHAINLLNTEDGGHRKCILVTNNEVSEAEANALIKKGYQPGDEEWERYGIARYVAWPRTVCSIEGHDINGKPLKGNYLENDIPMADGFKANAVFFKLGFLNKNAVALGTQFKKLLPVLWMKSGCVGPCPELKDDTLPEMLVLPENRFAVLLEEYQFAEFERQLAETDNIDTVFIVTDSEAGYKDMIRHLNVKNTYQLYRDYLDNFRINVAR